MSPIPPQTARSTEVGLQFRPLDLELRNLAQAYFEGQMRKRKYYKPFSKKNLEMLLPGQIAISEDSEEEEISEEDAISEEEDDISEEGKSQ
ncbi:hypothetical protein AVEN_172418-1 [Araneus ventricosus]|uniref:Uncharacterized protein n=1 Tax=Araneus ventricosus TaxID=182803 RepID=A0A4Y2RG70_ARAVE|nr:hypothetical protein AVEN_74658-1 [Araneus ventricosus]GBN74799.1 hypothetical protein AVEN_172418-1 [Araneus ventricosus]